MNGMEKVAIIQQFYDAWDSQDIETVDKLTHEILLHGVIPETKDIPKKNGCIG